MELLDYFNEKMEPLGVATREEVHQKGYWHKTFHCWIIWQKNNKNYILFQKRSLLKDNSPGKFDISAAGHFMTGESVKAAARELNEELGVHFDFKDLILLDIIKDEDISPVQINREFCHTYFLVLEPLLDTLQVQVEEVSGLLPVEVDLAKKLIQEKVTAIDTTLYAWKDQSPPLIEKFLFQKSALIVRPDSYYLRVLDEADRILKS